MTADRLIQLAQLALRFGAVERKTMRPDGRSYEDDAEHTVMLGLVACQLAAELPELRLNLGQVAQMALVHDLVEVYAGDTATICPTPAILEAKAERERLALQQLDHELGEAWITQMIRVYERQDSPEARFVRYVDKLLPKAVNVLCGGAGLRQMGLSLEDVAESHQRQRAQLAAEYSEFAPALDPLFGDIAGRCEQALEECP